MRFRLRRRPRFRDLEITVEIWRDIPGYEGRYQASDLGQVRALPHYVRLFTRWGKEMQRLSPGRILKPGACSSGHVTVSLGRHNSKGVHRLVLEAFVGPCPEGMEALHGPDHNPANNRLDNLRWGTRSQNLKDDYDRGARVPLDPPLVMYRWGYA